MTTTDVHRSQNPWPELQDRLRVPRQAANRDDLGAFGTFVEQGSAAGA